MLHLAVGRLEIDWGKNHGFRDHSALFQGEDDVSEVPYYYAGEELGPDVGERPTYVPIVEWKEGLSKPLLLVVDRLNLLGHTLRYCEDEFAFLSELNGFDRGVFTFEALRTALSTVEVSSLSLDYGEGGEYFGKFFRREIAPRLGLESWTRARWPVYDPSEGMENISTSTVLHLLARNRSASSLPVTWAFTDIATNEYASRDSFVRKLAPQARFLIVTEGSSDANILRHAFTLLRPHIADFFDFVDMEEGYPFSGTGNLFRFVQGLISIAVQNKILVLFDNDIEGMFNYDRCTALNVPTNMRIVRLPDLPAFASIKTWGPDGQSAGDINGRAAAIECYLDVGDEAQVRWTSYHLRYGAYQGELEGKTRYARAFLDQAARANGHDYNKIEKVLDMLVNAAVEISYDEAIRDLYHGVELLSE